ncbi:MAG TPA: EF-hand domain-containing protein [Planctomycetaceae bacterium]|nr:EF-hand domain-containing protein [Planctomycetaceae bacterium]
MGVWVLRSSIVVGLALWGSAGRTLAQESDSASGRAGDLRSRPAETPAGRPAVPAGRSAERARLFEQLDRDGDGRLTLDELPDAYRERVRPLFERLGTDAITPADFDRLNEPPGQRAARPPGFRGPAIFRALDEDGDGRISREELSRAGEWFDELDLDGNGVLTPDELFALPGGAIEPARPTPEPGTGIPATTPTTVPAPTRAASGGPLPPDGDLADRLFQRYDRDRDGRLSSEEAPAALRRHFERFDADGDGQIDAAEFRDVATRIESSRAHGQRP